MYPLAILGLGPSELLLVLLIVLVIFGAGKIPQIGSSLGKGIRNFRKAVKGEEEDSDPAKEPPSAPPPA